MDNKNINNNEQATQETPHPYRKDMSFAQRTRDRKIRWLVLSIIFSLIFLTALYDLQYMAFSLPFYYTIPFSLPALMSWVMFIGVTKIDSVNKNGYRVARAFVTIMIIVSFFLILITSAIIVSNHEDITTDPSDYERARDILNVEHFPETIPSTAHEVFFDYFSGETIDHMYLVLQFSEDDFEKELSLVQSSALTVTKQEHEDLDFDVKFYFNISDYYPSINDTQFYSNAQIYYFDHNLTKNSAYSDTSYTCCAIVSKENNVIVYYYHLFTPWI